jgi:hypothetical protein
VWVGPLLSDAFDLPVSNQQRDLISEGVEKPRPRVRRRIFNRFWAQEIAMNSLRRISKQPTSTRVCALIAPNDGGLLHRHMLFPERTG